MWRRVEQLPAGVDRGFLAVAVLAHDMAYCRDGQRHAQVAAAALARVGVDERVVAAVAHHSGSLDLARRRGHGADYVSLPPTGGPFGAALTYLDATTGPDGQPVMFDRRLADIVARFGAGSIEADSFATLEGEARVGAEQLGVPFDPEPDRTLLVLDAGGVLFTDPFELLRREAADAAGVAPDVVAAWWRQDGRAACWGSTEWPGASGAILDAATTQGAAAVFATRLDIAARSALIPLVPDAALTALATSTPVWVLSNHRSEWLHAAALRAGWNGLVDRWFISSETGIVKPDPAAFAQVDAAWMERCRVDAADAARTVVFVDDQARNRRAAPAPWVVIDGSDPLWLEAAATPRGA